MRQSNSLASAIKLAGIAGLAVAVFFGVIAGLDAFDSHHVAAQIETYDEKLNRMAYLEEKYSAIVTHYLENGSTQVKNTCSNIDSDLMECLQNTLPTRMVVEMTRQLYDIQKEYDKLQNEISVMKLA